MIIPMPTTARAQQRYDHRLRHLVQRTGDVTVAANLGVPRSTARGWLGAPPTVVPGAVDEIAEAMVIALLRAGRGRHARDHRRFGDAAQLLKTMRGVRPSDDNSRKEVQNVRGDSSEHNCVLPHAIPADLTSRAVASRQNPR